MNEQNIKEVLRIITDRLEENFTWRVEGSANLKIQGVKTPVKDFDITTNDEGINIFRNYLNEYIVKDFFSKKINGKSLICDINGFEVEINSYRNRKLDMFDKSKIIYWKNLKVPILPLNYAKAFYEQINRKEKVDLISKYIK